MASNFKISIHRNSDNLHLKLRGDFDSSSAYKLLNVLKKSSNGSRRVIIHTSTLKNIVPFGRDVFQKNLSIIGEKSLPLVFTGEHAILLAPEGSYYS